MPKRSAAFKPGDTVGWNTSQGPTVGTVKKKLIRPAAIRRHKVEASPQNPEYLVQSTKTGKLAAHKPGALKKVRRKAS